MRVTLSLTAACLLLASCDGDCSTGTNANSKSTAAPQASNPSTGPVGHTPGLPISARHNQTVMGKVEVLSPTTPAEFTYTTRAVITGLPASGHAYVELHHEHIPTFVDREGKATGMKEMIMDFPAVSEAIDLAEWHVGDKVRVTFEVRYKADPRSLVTNLEKLDAATQLELSEVMK